MMSRAWLSAVHTAVGTVWIQGNHNSFISNKNIFQKIPSDSGLRHTLHHMVHVSPSTLPGIPSLQGG